MQALSDIPLVDIREGGPLRQAQANAARARALRDDCLSFFPKPVTAALPMLDSLARRWLSRSQSPYVREIEGIAAALGFSGVWFLNGSYSWGCTTMSRDEDEEPWLVRTLDWPFPDGVIDGLLTVLAVGGSLVQCRNTAAAALARRAETERTTARLEVPE